MFATKLFRKLSFLSCLLILPVLALAGSGTIQLPLSGDVFGPGSATDNAVVRFDGTDGTLLQDSGVLLSDSEDFTGIQSLAFSATGSAPLATNYQIGVYDVAGLPPSHSMFFALDGSDDVFDFVVNGTSALVLNATNASFGTSTVSAGAGNFGTILGTGQATFTLNPANTTASSASVYINPATSSANEKFLTIADNGVAVFTVDKEGDVSTGSLSLTTALTDANVSDALTISGGTVNNTVIGGVTPAAGTFSSISLPFTGTTTTGFSVISDSLTSGSAAQINSNSSDATSRTVFQVSNIHASATGATAMSVSQSSTNIGLSVSRGAVNSSNTLLNVTDPGTGGGATATLNKSGGAYTTNIGVANVVRSGNFTGVNGETAVDFRVAPTATMTEPGAGNFTYSAGYFDVSGVPVTAGAGNGSVVALTAIAGTDTDAAQNTAIAASGNINIQSGFVICKSQTSTIPDDGAGTAAAATVTPTSCDVQITCNDANGCNVTMAEPAGISGASIKLVNMSTNTVNFADSAGVTELTGAFAAGQYDSIAMTYQTDRWVEDARSNN